MAVGESIVKMIIHKECVMVHEPSGRYIVKNRAPWRAQNVVRRHDNLVGKTRFLCSVCDFGEILKSRLKPTVRSSIQCQKD